MEALSVFMFVLAVASFREAFCTDVRGIHPDKKSSYNPGRDFTCLDGSSTVPFSYVNDDYCDCKDGSDEPGTSACPSGKYHCINKGHKSEDILSSRVNDGICDCCDGSDEWDSSGNCEDRCVEMGLKAAEESRRLRELYQQGYQKKLEYAANGRQRVESSRLSLTEKETELEKLKAEVDSLRELKELAEAPENEAKEAHRQKWEEEKAARKEAKRKADAQLGFDELDTNSDGYVSLDEIRARSELDNDSDGEVSESEALEYLDNAQYVNFDTFLENVWDVVSDKCQFQKPTTEPPSVIPPAAPVEDYVNPEAGEEGDPDDYDDDYDDDDEEDEIPPAEEEEEKMPEYDSETKSLIEVADQARATFREADKKKGDLERERDDLSKYLGMDFGGDYAFSQLYDNCYEFTDREYTYKMCAFSKVTQRSKSGGRETSLGTWGSWNGPSDNPYSSMLYDNGEKCWNGPSRSATVSIQCGLEDKLLSASEPNRCEYAMEFSTPAACDKPHPASTGDVHEEL